MKIVANSLIVLFAIKCLKSFSENHASIGDGIFLIACMLYIFYVLDRALPADSEVKGRRREQKTLSRGYNMQHHKSIRK